MTFLILSLIDSRQECLNRNPAGLACSRPLSHPKIKTFENGSSCLRWVDRDSENLGGRHNPASARMDSNLRSPRVREVRGIEPLQTLIHEQAKSIIAIKVSKVWTILMNWLADWPKTRHDLLHLNRKHCMSTLKPCEPLRKLLEQIRNEKTWKFVIFKGVKLNGLF